MERWMPEERWMRYRCVECEFEMLVPWEQEGGTELCPRCMDVPNSLMTDPYVIRRRDTTWDEIQREEAER
jgi:hypothetical protein